MKCNWKKVLKSKSMMWTLLFCMAAGAAAGTFYRNSKMEQKGTSVVSGIQENKTDPSSSYGAGSVPAENSNQVSVKNAETQKEYEEQQETEEAESREKEDASSAVSAAIPSRNLDFISSHTLRWPVEGEVLLEFNMDETIYFPTLNVYK